MKCNSCSKEFEEKQIEEHHIHPKFMDNIKGYGKKIPLCKKCHIILHLKIPSIIWKYLSTNAKNKCITEIKDFTLNFNIKNKENNPHIGEQKLLKTLIKNGFIVDRKVLGLLIRNKEDINIINRIGDTNNKRIITLKDYREYKRGERWF